MPRNPESGATKTFNSIKELVLDYVSRNQGNVTYEDITEEVMKVFPQSKWNKNHWAWYRNKIINKAYAGKFSPVTIEKLKGQVASKLPVDLEAKRIGDEILASVRKQVLIASNDNDYLRFRINRWIHARLNGDERKWKAGIRRKLIETEGSKCADCQIAVPNGKGLHVHRINRRMDYRDGNCMLLCRKCHERIELLLGKDANSSR